MGAGGNGNNQREWEGNGNKARLNMGLGMGMNHREWEGMGLKKHSRSSLVCRLETNRHQAPCTSWGKRGDRRHSQKQEAPLLRKAQRVCRA